MRLLPGGRQLERFPLILGALLLALALGPYVAGYLHEPTDHEFLGFVENPTDSNPYVSWIRQAAEGKVFLESRYSSEPVEPHLFNLMTFLLGNVARLTGLSPIAVYQGSRLLFGALLLAAIWWACGRFAPHPRTRKFAFAWIACGAGVHWAFVLVAQLRDAVRLAPGQAWDHVILAMPEAYAFYSLFAFPHLAASMALMVVALTTYWEAVRARRPRRALAGGAAALALGGFHPYPLLVVGGVVAAHALVLLFTRRGSRALALAALALLLPTAAGLAWNQFMFSRDAVLAGWRVQNITPAGSPLRYLLAWGFAGWLVPFSLYGFWRGFGRGRKLGGGETGGILFLALWVLATALLIYAPVPFQRRLIEGVQVPLVLISAMGVARFLEARSGARSSPAGAGRARRSSLAVMAALMAVSAPSSALLAARGFARVASGEPAWYASGDELAALAWLDAHARPGSVVLASVETSNRIPRFIRCRVFAGHFCQTLDFDQKSQVVASFFRDPITLEQRARFLDYAGVDWLLVGPRERALGPFDPAASPLFADAYRAGSVAVYAARR